ncbi:MAG: hypothetical protein ACK4M6_05425 [Hyphomonas sp.]
MSPASTSSVRLRRSVWERIRLALMVVALAALTYLVAQIIFAMTSGAFSRTSENIWGIAFAMFIYLGAHGFRILRLGMLIGGWRVGLRTIASFHLMTAAVGYTAPLKLGELYRVIELTSLAGSFVRAVLIVWWERAFDVAVILMILAFAFATTPANAHTPFYAIAAAAGAFMLGTAVAFFVVPDNFRRLSLLIIRRYDSPRSVALLRVLHTARDAIQEAPGLVANKLPSLITLTALIWACEITCFAILLPAVSGSIGAAAEHLMSFLSTITLGETLLSTLDSEKGEALNYFAATQVPLALLGLGAGLVYAAMRWKRGTV